MIKHQLIYVLTLYSMLVSVSAMASIDIITPKTFSAQDHYAQVLLHKALSAKDNRTPPRIATKPTNLSGHALQQALLEDEISVMWQTTSKALELEFNAVKIPIYKGLEGYQIILTNKSMDLSSIRYLTQTKLKNYTFGQLRASENANTLLSSGLTTYTASKPAHLLHMLEGGRFDMLPIPLLVFDTYNKIMIEKGLDNGIHRSAVALAYTQPIYYFTNNAKLANDLRQGINILIKSGEFDQFYYQQTFVKNAISKLSKENLNIVQLENHNLPNGTPIAQSHLWLDISLQDTVVAKNLQ
ncbi:hypothetical protein [Algibacillus agarilyticus]|uniref:hypothetical protein n=1 Tax=Algibacillus agarilyticus TaxID=2234133 RepID=UPI000DD0B98C|nr:hypothetical protein [Algibacillus agarilyticus]